MIQHFFRYCLAFLLIISSLYWDPGKVSGNGTGVIAGGKGLHPDTTVTLVYDDTLLVESFREFDFPVVMQNGNSVSAISLGLVFPPEYLEILGVDMAQGTQGYFYNVSDSLLSFAWSSPAPLTVADGEVLLSLRLRSLDLAGLPEPIRLELGGICEFADASANVIDNILLVIPVLMLPTVPEEEYVKVYPNPFRETAVVEFYLAEESHVKISICNLAGQELGTVEDRTFPVGTHQAGLYSFNFSQGIYLLKFESDNGRDEGVKIIRMMALPDPSKD